jgi:hypothetical protein
VYQGAPAGIVGYMAAAAKIGGLRRPPADLVLTAFGDQIDTWAPLVAAVAAISMVLGAIVAVVQDDVRRVLAYSGVAHAGFILTGMVAGATGADDDLVLHRRLQRSSWSAPSGWSRRSRVRRRPAPRSTLFTSRPGPGDMPFLAAVFSVLLARDGRGSR